jgi:hypothetical protein
LRVSAAAATCWPEALKKSMRLESSSSDGTLLLLRLRVPFGVTSKRTFVIKKGPLTHSIVLNNFILVPIIGINLRKISEYVLKLIRLLLKKTCLPKNILEIN